MRAIGGMEIKARKDEVLETLRKNREEHAAIVAEARIGYVQKAKEALRKRLDQLEFGELASLNFSLSPPQDHTRVYDVAIRMLEMEQRETVILDSGQVQTLVMDRWDWQENFLAQTMHYSNLANEKRGTL